MGGVNPNLKTFRAMRARLSMLRMRLKAGGEFRERDDSGRLVDKTNEWIRSIETEIQALDDATAGMEERNLEQ